MAVPDTTPQTAATPGRMLATGAVAGLAGGIAALIVALIARALGVPLEVSQPGVGITTPAPVAFVIATVIQALIGAGLALAIQRWTARPARTFAITAAVLVVLSFVQPIVAAQDTATAITLMLSHVAAAAVVVPALVRQLPARR
jgi:hypothetical protein